MSSSNISSTSRNAMISLITATHHSQWSPVDVASFPSTRTLSICIDNYLKHFHETLPILRRDILQRSEVNPVLLLSAAAIGATYSANGLSRLATALNELARRAISYVRESDKRAMFDTSVVQAWLLQAVFGLFCGSRMLYQHAEISRGGLITAARRMHLLRPGLSFVAELEKSQQTPTRQDLARAWARDEERRRLGWGIYVSTKLLSLTCYCNNLS
jgi:hypothetical protein